MIAFDIFLLTVNVFSYFCWIFFFKLVFYDIPTFYHIYKLLLFDSLVVVYVILKLHCHLFSKVAWQSRVLNGFLHKRYTVTYLTDTEENFSSFFFSFFSWNRETHNDDFL